MDDGQRAGRGSDAPAEQGDEALPTTLVGRPLLWPHSLETEGLKVFEGAYGKVVRVSAGPSWAVKKPIDDDDGQKEALAREGRALREINDALRSVSASDCCGAHHVLRFREMPLQGPESSPTAVELVTDWISPPAPDFPRTLEQLLYRETLPAVPWCTTVHEYGRLVRCVVAQVVGALAAIKRAFPGWCHNDLHENNVMLAPHDGTPCVIPCGGSAAPLSFTSPARAVIIDFGFSSQPRGRVGAAHHAGVDTIAQLGSGLLGQGFRTLSSTYPLWDLQHALSKWVRWYRSKDHRHKLAAALTPLAFFVHRAMPAAMRTDWTDRDNDNYFPPVPEFESFMPPKETWASNHWYRPCEGAVEAAAAELKPREGESDAEALERLLRGTRTLRR